MLIDARDLSAGHVIETDVCVIGAGAAGISLALTLANTRWDRETLHDPESVTSDSGGDRPSSGTNPQPSPSRAHRVGLTGRPPGERSPTRS